MAKSAKIRHRRRRRGERSGKRAVELAIRAERRLEAEGKVRAERLHHQPLPRLQKTAREVLGSKMSSR